MMASSTAPSPFPCAAGARQGVNSNTKERTRSSNTFSSGRQDRQPPGRPGIHRRAWLAWLQEKAIPFHIRIRSNIQHAWSHGQGEGAVSRPQTRGKLSSPTPGASRRPENPRPGPSSFHPGELLIVANDAPDVKALAIYAQRWQIENLRRLENPWLQPRRHPHDRPGAHLQAHRRPFHHLLLGAQSRRLAPRGRADRLKIRFRVDKATARQSYRQASSH